MIKTRIVRAHVQPRLVSTGALTSLYLAGGGNRCPYRFGGVDYKAGLDGIPRFKAAIEWGEAGWTGGVVPSTASMRWAPSTAADYKNWSTLYAWKDAPITVEVGEEGFDGSAPAAWSNILTGTVAGISAAEGFITLTIADLSARLDKPIITGRFTGAGGIEGPVEAANRVKRRSFGTCFNIECRILDKANSIYEWGDPAFASTSVSAVRDMGRAATGGWTTLGWQGSIASTFAALQAAAVPAGTGVVAPSIQCVKWWTAPVGPLTVDVVGEYGSLTAPNIATLLVDLFGSPLTYTVGDRSAAIAARPDSAGLHIDDSSMTLANALDRLLLGVSMIWVADATGFMRFLPISFSSPVETVKSLAATRVRAYPAQKTRRLGYQRNERQHSDGEIAASVLLADVSGAGQLAGLNAVDFASQVTGAQKPADNATVNRVYYQATAPASPVDGDVWVDTSGYADVVKARVAGAWQVGANLTPGTTYLVDDAGLGNTALWTGVSGNGKPANNATADLALTPSNGSVTLVGNTMTQTVTSSNYGYFAVAQALAGPAFVEEDITTGWTIIGLDSSATDADYTLQAAMAFYYRPNGACQIYSNGTLIANATIATGLNGKVSLAFDGAKLRMAVAGIERHVIDAPAAVLSAAGLFPKWWAYELGMLYTGLRIGPFNNATWAGVVGTGKPADNASADLTLTALNANLKIVGNTISQTVSAGGDYSYCAVGVAMVGPSFAEVDAYFDGTFSIAGLDTDNTTTALADQDVIALFNGNTGEFYVYKAGVLAHSASIGVGLGAKLSVAYDGVKVRVSVWGIERVALDPPAAFTLTGQIYPKFWANNIRVYGGLRAGPFNNAHGSVLGEGTVTTPKLPGAAVTVPAITTGSAVFIPDTGAEVDILTSSSITIGDAVYGGALVEVQGSHDNSSGGDAGAQVHVDVSVNGGAYVRYSTHNIGQRSTSGTVYGYTPFREGVAVGGPGTPITTVQVKMRANSIYLPGAGVRKSSYISDPKVFVMGGKR